MKAIFTLSPGSRYDDLPEQRYHFPRTYLKQVEQATGDWIIYYEPRRNEGIMSSGGRQSYFAVAHLDSVRDDPNQHGLYYADISNYLEFLRPVPFREGDHYYESALRGEEGRPNRGAFQRSVRLLTDDEFNLILQAGFVGQLEPWEDPQEMAIAVAEDRPVIEQLIRRPLRDRAFRRQIRAAYNNTCAITGFSLRNGKGRPEVEAAHIRPVEASGPDSVRNGLALTGTVHWLFDRGLISLDDDYRLLISSPNIPESLNTWLVAGRQIHLPQEAGLRPHPAFIHWHRENRFNKNNKL